MPEIKLIALDLDGTLLNSRKELTVRNRTALTRAAARGIEIVPATGRFYSGMPEAVRTLPFIHYAITINGAEVRDLVEDKALYTSLIPIDEAVEIMAYFDTLPLIYDCYQDNSGWMTAAMRERAAEFTEDPHYIQMIRDLRKPVPELKEFLRKRNRGVQKIQIFTMDMKVREEILHTLGERFPGLSVTSSVPNNVEINSENANKGVALQALLDYLHIKNAAAFGDGLNDTEMLRVASCGVAMGNAQDCVKEVADAVTGSCDDDGVAQYVEKILEGDLS